MPLSRKKRVKAAIKAESRASRTPRPEPGARVRRRARARPAAREKSLQLRAAEVEARAGRSLVEEEGRRFPGLEEAERARPAQAERACRWEDGRALEEEARFLG